MHGARTFLQDLALVFCAGAVVTLVFQRLRQPAVLGYLLAGVLVGPHVPTPIFVDAERIQTLSELGVILVMFSIGLEFSVGRLARVLPTSGLTGFVQILAMLWLGYSIGQLFGWSARESLFVGAMISISSTMVLSRVLPGEDKRLTQTVFGVLIVQDLAAILLLTLLTAIGSGAGLPPREVAVTVGKLGGFLLGGLAIGILVVPRLVRESFRQENSETLLVTAVGICFGVALLAEKMGYSVALGAFLAGTLVSESGRRHQVEHVVAPLRDVFAAVFFVAIGMLVDPSAVVDCGGLIAVLTVAVLVGQTVFASIGAFLTGNSVHTSIRTGMSLAQVGEFSFIIASVGVATGAASPRLLAVAAAVCALTTFTTPYMVRLSRPFALWVDRRLPPPVQTTATLYGSWLENMRSRLVERRRGELRQSIWRLVFDGGVILGAIAGTNTGEAWAVSQGGELGLSPAAAKALLWGLALVVAAPFVLGVVRQARALGLALAQRALPESETGLDLADAPRRVFVVSLQLGVVLAVGIALMALSQPFLPPFAGLGVLVSLIAALGVVFWRNASNLHGHVRASAEVVLEALAAQRAEEAPDMSQVEELLPGLGTLRPWPVEEGTGAVGKSLAELNLRGLTGATVVAIHREGGNVVVPAGSECLRCGDVLMLAGPQEAMEAAAAVLSGQEIESSPAVSAE